MTIGEYRTLRLLGRGGMSEVYEAENLRVGSRHALKLFAYDRDDADVRRRFSVEGRLLAQLCHPRIVKVTDLGEMEDGRPYFVMDLVLDANGRCRSLADVEPGTADEDTIGGWYDDIREGLSYIHGHGVVHRDLKLENVLIGPDGHAVLTDFGISKISEGRKDAVKINDTVNTIVRLREGRTLVMGSLGYMAPELEMGVEASPQSDWYALGVLVYRLLTGTWCDARTDLVGNLDSYMPAWSRILPKLLHANPNGRECLSFAKERRSDCENYEFELENQCLAESARAKRAWHWHLCTIGLSFGLLAALVAVSVCTRHSIHQMQTELTLANAKLALPSFSDVCQLPQVSDDRPGGGWADVDRKRKALALVDVWVLSHSVFDDLRAEKITYKAAIEQMDLLAQRSEDQAFGLFGGIGGYIANGDARTRTRILKDAVEKMRRRFEAQDASFEKE